MKLSVKITVFTVLIALIVASLCPVVFAQTGDTLVITSEEVTAERGSSVQVNLVVTENPGIAGLRIRVEDDAAEGFEVTEVKNGSIKSAMTADYYILWDDSKNTSTVGTLVTLTIKISDEAPLGANTIDVIAKDCCNAALENVDVSTAPIVINVQEKTAQESETETETEIESQPSASTGSLVIDVAEVSAKTGETVSVVLNVVENPGIAGLLITVPEIKGLELQEVTNGTIIDTMTAGINILWDDVENSTATGALVTLTYKVTDSAPLGTNTVNVIVRSCNDADLREVSVVVDPIVINVTAGSAQASSGCNRGCSGEIGFGAMIVTTLVAGAWFFRKKH